MTDQQKRAALRELFEALIWECFTEAPDPQVLLIRYTSKLRRLKREWARAALP